MPRVTEFKQMSKSEQAAYLATLRRNTPVPRKRVAADAAVVAALPREKEDPGPRDGLEWLVKKKKLTRAQAAEAWALRRGFREDGGEIEGIVSCLEAGMGGGGGGAASGLQLRLAQVSDDRRHYLLVVGSVLWHDPQLVAVVDGVCGRGYTLRYLAGGDRHQADRLEVALQIALNLVVAWKADIARGRRRLTNGAETPDQSDIAQKCA